MAADSGENPIPFPPEYIAEPFTLFAITKRPLIEGELVEVRVDSRGVIRCPKLKFIGSTPRIAKIGPATSSP